MTHDQINEEAEHFFEWPTKDRTQVTFTSCCIFARVMVQMERDELARVTGWRPISEAPKDRTEILAWLPHEDQISIVRFGMQKMWLEGSRPCGEPTHWQPLPQPPEAA